MNRQRITLILAETRPEVTESLCALLGTDEAFAEPAVAADPQAALDLLGRLRPVLLLLDPHCGGEPDWEVVRQTRLLAPETIIAIHSNSLPAERLLQALRVGASDLIYKGIPPLMLLRRLKMAAAGEFLLNPLVARLLLAELAFAGGRQASDRPLLGEEVALLREIAAYGTIGDISGRQKRSAEQIFGSIREIIAKVQYAYSKGEPLMADS